MPTVKIEIPELHEQQQMVADEAGRFNVLECGRRWGKTTMGVDLAVQPAIEGKLVGWFAPTYKTMAEQWKEITKILQPIIASQNKVEQQVRLSTGGVIDFWSLDNADSGRGRKYHRVIVDEASLVRDLEEAWQATIRPTLTDYQGDAWLLGTPKGRRFFHQCFLKGQRGDRGWNSWRLGTVTNPYMDPAEVADAKRDLPKHIFEQEYLGIPADDGGNPFGLKAIAACKVDALSTGTPVAYGVDLAKSVDWTVACGLDADGRVCSLERWQGDWGATRQRILALCNGWPTLIDSTGVGDPIVEDLSKVRPNIKGFKFTSQSKQQLMEGLAVAIHRQETRYPAGWLSDELESFEYEYTRTGVKYNAPQGLHDDGVCALALALQQLRTRTTIGIAESGQADSYNEGDIWD